MNGIKQVYLNGKFLAPDAAQVSVFDRGFIFGDGVYEVIPVFGGRLFRLDHHLERLAASLEAIRLPHPLTHAEWAHVLEQLIVAHGGGDQSVYLQVTRGVAPRDHAFPPHTVPTVFAYAQPVKFAPPETPLAGVTAATRTDIRWHRCDIKSIALLANALLRQEALDDGAVEAILIRDGFITEGAASNIFIAKNGQLVTPPKSHFILPGITRDLVVELAQEHGIPWKEAPVSEAEMFAADEVWLTSSIREILPVTRIDDRTIGDGRPGPLHARLMTLYREYKKAFREGRAH